MNKETAKNLSSAKWIKQREQFSQAFEDIHAACGYCTYSVDHKILFQSKCKTCLINFPEIHQVCAELIAFFESTHTKVDAMIDKIIATIENQEEN